MAEDYDLCVRDILISAGSKFPLNSHSRFSNASSYYFLASKTGLAKLNSESFVIKENYIR